MIEKRGRMVFQSKKELLEENINLENAKYRLESEVKNLNNKIDNTKKDLEDIKQREIELRRKLRLIFDILMGDAEKTSKCEVLMDLLGVTTEKQIIEEEKKSGRTNGHGFVLNNDGIGRPWDY
jgi:chromosome segregation ATPase